MAYRINCRTLFSSTYSTKHGDLLIMFHKGNSKQNSLVRNQYGIQKITTIVLLIKIAFVGHPLSFFLVQSITVGSQD